jgi:hypothetical protein
MKHQMRGATQAPTGHDFYTDNSSSVYRQFDCLEQMLILRQITSSDKSSSSVSQSMLDGRDISIKVIDWQTPQCLFSKFLNHVNCVSFILVRPLC